MFFGFYAVFLKQLKCGELRYGRNYYDYQEGTLLFIAPGQVIGDNTYQDYQPSGHALVFHPELIHGTTLGRTIHEYSFFAYDANEALHVSDIERHILLDCLQKIKYETAHAVDKHSKKLIAANIELLLQYCQRFYDRQFITRDGVHKGILEKLEALLNHYLHSNMPQESGTPSVNFCAKQLHLSTNYLGDLVKKETGISAQEYIQNKLMHVAKEQVFDTSQSISQIAYKLGFNYPQHFARLFKQRTGYTPSQYRSVAEAQPKT
jgi:AraC-like DNA-binding protein